MSKMTIFLFRTQVVVLFSRTYWIIGASPKSAEARAILQKYEIDINDPTNGVFIPTVRDIAEGTYHSSLHTDYYYRKVTD